jgi:hypothetical protein
MFGGVPKTFSAVNGDVNRVALGLEPTFQRSRDAYLVLDNQDPHLGSSSPQSGVRPLNPT